MRSTQRELIIASRKVSLTIRQDAQVSLDGTVGRLEETRELRRLVLYWEVDPEEAIEAMKFGEKIC